MKSNSPAPIRILESKYNGTLEVTTRRGRKVLDTENANYSYGTAQSLWQKVLATADMNDVDHILILGLGGGTIVDILRNRIHYRERITAVEIDPVIIRIAKEEFGIVKSGKMKIECIDASEYVSLTTEQFDLILVDISIDFTLPPVFLTLKFWRSTLKRLNAGGLILFNALDYRSELAPVKELLRKEGFAVKTSKKYNGINNILSARRK